MAEQSSNGLPPAPLFASPWPSYWTTNRRIERLTRFKNLVIHHQRWAGDIDTAPSLEDLFPGENLDVGSYGASQRIELEIRQGLMVAFRDLQQAGITARTNINVYSQVEQRETMRDCDLILDYFRLHDRDDNQRAYESLLQRLDMGIGVYQASLPATRRALYSPISWMAYVIRIPVAIFERAGLASHPKTQEKLIDAYAWVMRIAMLAAVLLILAHYGMKIPWADAFSAIVKAFSK